VLWSVLAGHRRYAHITALRCDPVSPPLLAMRKGAEHGSNRMRTRCVSTRSAHFAALVAAVIPDAAQGKPIELWWQDEARIASKAA
jgi:hypothetical protein